jgi:chromosome segregation ATPase
MQPLRDSITRLEQQFADLERFKAAHQNIQQLRGELTWGIIEQREKVKLPIHLYDHLGT